MYACVCVGAWNQVAWLSRRLATYKEDDVVVVGRELHRILHGHHFHICQLYVCLLLHTKRVGIYTWRPSYVCVFCSLYESVCGSFFVHVSLSTHTYVLLFPCRTSSSRVYMCVALSCVCDTNVYVCDTLVMHSCSLCVCVCCSLYVYVCITLSMCRRVTLSLWARHSLSLGVSLSLSRHTLSLGASLSLSMCIALPLCMCIAYLGICVCVSLSRVCVSLSRVCVSLSLSICYDLRFS